MNGNQRVVLYSRVSTNNGQDPEVQSREIREYCERRGWKLADNPSGQTRCELRSALPLDRLGQQGRLLFRIRSPVRRATCDLPRTFLRRTATQGSCQQVTAIALNLTNIQ
jgi:DNA invertase Pin-like site-specific DNA recombinase